jgi:hypothetical protein
MEPQQKICACIRDVITDGSASGRLVGLQEILSQLEARGLAEPADIEQGDSVDAMLKQALHENHDLRRISGPTKGCWFYSDRSMSDSYAGILAWKAESPACLIAQVVRDNARTYPRPVPMAGFTAAPFDLTMEQIGECLEAMMQDIEYQDITQTITSIGTAFLYSTRHLDPDYAAMLAEWMDVGQADNP